MKTHLGKFEQLHFVLIYSVAFVVAAVFSIILGSFLDTNTNIYIFLLYLLPQVSYLSVVVVVVLTQKIEFRLLDKSTLKLSHYLLTLLLALGMFFVALLPNYYLQSLFARLGIAASVTLPSIVSYSDYVFAVLFICILPPLGEEIVFRKVLCDSLEGVADWKVILLSGAIFSLTHFNLAQTFYQFFFGATLAYLYLKTKNITLPIIIHIINNLFALFITGITGEAMWNNISVLAVSFAIGAVLYAVSLFFIIKNNPPLQKGNNKIMLITYIFLFVVVLLWVVNIVLS